MSEKTFKFGELSAELRGNGMLIVQDRWDTVVCDSKEALALRDWLNEVLPAGEAK
jgi:hypothetical protein